MIRPGGAYRLILASASPRRKELLEKAGLRFTVRPADVDERIESVEEPAGIVLELARRKARHVANREERDSLVLGFDTLVLSPENELLGKPADHSDAERMLRSLLGKRHRVMTGCSAWIGQEISPLFEFTETTTVHFREIPENLLSLYLAGNEPYDKAGAYGIQGFASIFLDRLEGDYFNVVGLPVARLFCHLEQSGPGLPWILENLQNKTEMDKKADS